MTSRLLAHIKKLDRIRYHMILKEGEEMSRIKMMILNSTWFPKRTEGELE